MELGALAEIGIHGDGENRYFQAKNQLYFNLTVAPTNDRHLPHVATSKASPNVVRHLLCIFRYLDF